MALGISLARFKTFDILDRVNSRSIMKTFLFALFLCSSLLSNHSIANANGNTSIYTDIDQKSCKAVSGQGATWECPGKENFSVQILADDARSWLTFARVQSFYDSRQDLTKIPGNFPNITGTKLEWRYKGKEHIGWIFRVGTSDDTGKKSSHLAVVGYNGLHGCFLGYSKTNQGARNLIDKPFQCKP